MADWQTEARNTARRVGVDPDLFVALVRQESGGHQWSAPGQVLTSPSGALGRTQLMPDTARGLGVNPNDPAQNLVGGARYLKQQLDAFGGDTRKALAAYNAGPGAVQKYGGVPPFAETQKYVSSILGSLGPGSTSDSPASSEAPIPEQAVRALTSMDPGQSSGAAAALLSQLSSSRRQAPPSGALPAPAVTAGPVLPDAYRALAASQGPAPRRDVSALIAAVQTQGGGQVQGPASAAPVSDAGAPVTPANGAAGGNSPKDLPTGTAKFEGHAVAAWIAPALQYARDHGWKGQVNSGFRSLAEQTRIWNSGVQPAARPGTSNHEGADFPRGAVDVSEAEQLSQILAHSPYRKRLIWAGAKDPVHFSHPHDGSY